jgi:hypothetical protein
MGWLDYHLHEFPLLDALEQNVVSIGIPTDDDQPDRPVLAGWDVSLSTFFDRRSWHAPPATYAYDFGDDCSTSSPTRASNRPRRAGSTRAASLVKAGARLRTAAESRIRHLLQILVDTDHEEYASTLQWVGGHFDPAEFDPAAVKVDHLRIPRIVISCSGAS